MNISDIGTVFGMIVVALGGASTGATFYMEAKYITRAEPAPYGDIYVELSAQNLNLLYAAEDELGRLNARKNCDSECIARKATLKERIRNLKK
jgi:hypothetical protein